MWSVFNFYYHTNADKLNNQKYFFIAEVLLFLHRQNESLIFLQEEKKMKTTKYFGVIVILLLMLTALQVGNVSADDIITIQLQNSDGGLLTGGTLRYHDGNWQTAIDNGNGTFSVSTSAASVTYEMTYNNGRQTFSNVPVSTNPVTFITVSTTVALKDTVLNILSGGTVRYHQIGWQDFGNANSSGTLARQLHLRDDL